MDPKFLRNQRKAKRKQDALKKSGVIVKTAKFVPKAPQWCVDVPPAPPLLPCLPRCADDRTSRGQPGNQISGTDKVVIV